MKFQDESDAAKLERIESLTAFSNGEIASLLEFSKDSDEEIRMRALEALADSPRSAENEKAFLRGLQDEDELVRIAAIEGLEEYEDPQFAPYFLRGC